MLRDLAKSPEVFGTPAQPAYNKTGRVERWRQSGFMRDASEFWLLAQVMVVACTTKTSNPHSALGDHEAPVEFDQADMKDLKRFLTEFNSSLE